MPPPPRIPDLECNGNLSWSNIKAGGNVAGSFQVQNIGDNDSLLNWTVNNTITWGTWTFTPSSGEGLTPEQGPTTVHVHVVVPKKKNSEFHGNLTVQNKNNASDYVNITVTLTTSTSRTFSFNNPFLLLLFERIPNAFPILKILLGY